jgi:hypothetical protein
MRELVEGSMLSKLMMLSLCSMAVMFHGSAILGLFPSTKTKTEARGKSAG